jgi:hypothetical protein
MESELVKDHNSTAQEWACRDQHQGTTSLRHRGGHLLPPTTHLPRLGLKDFFNVVYIMSAH